MKTFRLKDRIRETRLFKGRIVIVIIFISLLSLVLVCRLLFLQIYQYDLYKTLSVKNRITLAPIEPRRGLIYDCNGVLLAKNIPVKSLVAVPNEIKNIKETVNRLTTVVKLSPEDIKQFYRQLKSQRSFEPTTIKVKLTDDEVAHFAVNSYKFPGVSVHAQLIRQYPMGELFAHVVGYVGRINSNELNQINSGNYAASTFIGKTGIEKYYESVLHGTVGYKKVEIDASGKPVRTVEVISPISGDNLYLTIDSKIQAAAEKALGDHSGAVVAIDPRKGAVLAIVSKPSFDPNLFVTGVSTKEYKQLSEDTSRPLYNRTINGLYAPGSTIKPFVALEGLNSGVITKDSSIFDPGWFQIAPNSHIFHDWKLNGHGWVNVTKAIIESCDTFFYYLGYHLGIDRVDDILQQFGFNHVSGIDLSGEDSGIVPTPQWKMMHYGLPWYAGDTILTTIGQSYLHITPLLLACATAILADRGINYRPFVVNVIQSPTGDKTSHEDVQDVPVILDHKGAWAIVIDAMSKVISSGTGYRFGTTPYTVASKTGTAQVASFSAQKLATGKLAQQLQNNSLFIAFAPVYKPKVALAVLVESDPHSAPTVARQVLDAVFSSGDKSAQVIKDIGEPRSQNSEQNDR